MAYQPAANKLFLALLPLFAYPASFAADAADSNAENEIIQLKEVQGFSSFAQQMGTQQIDQQKIQDRITTNGTVSELLKSNPNVKFSNANGNSNTPGEIAPENVSFHGEKFYNNNWMIDGMLNNDTTNPGANRGAIAANNPDGYRPPDLPAGGAQSFWINSDIIDHADVYDSNVSARYGQFTGGVIDAQLKNPDTLKSSGRVSYRTTRDSWAKYHIEGDDAFYNAENLSNQPKFTKHVFSINVNQPINDRAVLLFLITAPNPTFPIIIQT